MTDQDRFTFTPLGQWAKDVEAALQEKMMGPDHSKRGIFVYYRCWKCDDGAKPCVNGSPNRCDYPRARND